MTQASRVFPSVHSVLDPGALCLEVAGQYSVGMPESCVLLRSWINEVYELRAGGARYILKVFRRGWRSPEEVSYEVALMQHLAACGLAVAPPVARRDGGRVGLVAAPEGTRPLVLYPLLEGRPPLPPSEQVYRRVGRAVASMHRALDSFAPDAPRRALDFRTLAEEPLGWLRPFLEDRPADWEFLSALAQRVRRRLDALEQSGGLSWGPIHGDATLDNLLVTAGDQIGIYDFDQSGPGWRAYELQGVFYYAWKSQQPGFWPALLDGYSADRPLRATDIAAMPCFVVLNQLWCMGFESQVIAGNHGRWIVDASYFDRRIANLRSWAQAQDLGA